MAAAMALGDSHGGAQPTLRVVAVGRPSSRSTAFGVGDRCGVLRR